MRKLVEELKAPSPLLERKEGWAIIQIHPDAFASLKPLDRVTSLTSASPCARMEACSSRTMREPRVASLSRSLLGRPLRSRSRSRRRNKKEDNGKFHNYTGEEVDYWSLLSAGRRLTTSLPPLGRLTTKLFQSSTLYPVPLPSLLLPFSFMCYRLQIALAVCRADLS